MLCAHDFYSRKMQICTWPYLQGFQVICNMLRFEQTTGIPQSTLTRPRPGSWFWAWSCLLLCSKFSCVYLIIGIQLSLNRTLHCPAQDQMHDSTSVEVVRVESQCLYCDTSSVPLHCSHSTKISCPKIVFPIMTFSRNKKIPNICSWIWLVR